MPNPKPASLPLWGDTSTNIVVPPGGSAHPGYATGAQVPSGWVNWFWNLVYQWCAYLFDFENNTHTWSVAQTFSAAVAMTNGLNVTNGLTMSGGLVTDTLHVTGTSALDGAVTISTGGLHITAGGAVVSAGGLTVTLGGATIAAGGLNVTGNSTFNNTLDVTGLFHAHATSFIVDATTVTFSNYHAVWARLADLNGGSLNAGSTIGTPTLGFWQDPISKTCYINGILHYTGGGGGFPTGGINICNASTVPHPTHTVDIWVPSKDTTGAIDIGAIEIATDGSINAFSRLGGAHLSTDLYINVSWNPFSD